MPRLGKLDRLADYVAATDHEFVHATQEAVYFFFVVFLVDFELWPDTAPYVGAVLFMLALFRIVYYLIPYFLERRLGSILPLEERTFIVSAHESRDRVKLQQALNRYFWPLAAERLADLLLRHAPNTVRRLMKLN
jgi:hypothetical protein